MEEKKYRRFGICDTKSERHGGNGRVRSDPQSLPIPNPSRRGFTLVEMLVTITIIGIMAGMVFGALSLARESSRDAATKATIAKLNAIIMERYESYMTRRVPIQIPRDADPVTAAKMRLNAIRDLMRMEMPDAQADVANGPITLTYTYTVSGAPVTAYKTVPEPALHKIYAASTMSGTYDSAQCLYKIVSMGSPEAMEQFNQSEIGVTSDGKPVFIDAWGTPICFLRWAPGYSSPLSDIQTGNPSSDSDPFDPRRVDVDTQVPPQPRSFHMVPLIVSAGPNKRFGINDLDGARAASGAANFLLGRNPIPSTNVLDIYGDSKTGALLGSPTAVGTHQDNITNHHIEAR